MTGTSRRNASLEEIVGRFRERRYVWARHIFENAASGRPQPSDIVSGIVEDRPRITRDDEGESDDRGAVVEIECESPTGRTLVVRINYEKDPIVPFTQYWKGERGEGGAS
jgi:hypothetical protein